jgi:hypothetical protein
MPLPRIDRLLSTAPLLKDATASGNLAVLRSLLGPAWRGFVEQRAKADGGRTTMKVGYGAAFDWGYLRDRPALARLYEAAKVDQWNGSKDLAWSTSVDAEQPDLLLPEALYPMHGHPCTKGLTERELAEQRRSFMAWMLSQFLHGEQGALFAACQVTEAVPWMDAKLYGSSQVADEGRHVEVFHGYLVNKLEKKYDINDNLYVVIDALMSDSRWDMKFLGMQIMIEGLALGAFGMLRQNTNEPLLKQLLTRVITDEARHVHFGVLALQEFTEKLSERERREREDWTFEVSLFLRNRFLAHELYDEYYAHAMKRAEWNAVISRSVLMTTFRDVMFKRVVPNLKRIGLLSDRIRPKYAELGLLGYETGRAAPELTAKDLLDDKT